MALGNNLKRVKKDSLIPEKKKETPDKKSKTPVKSKTDKKEVIQAAPKAAKPTKSGASKTQQPKKVAVAKSKKAEPKSAPNTKAPEKVAPSSTMQPSMKANLEERVLLGGDENSTITVKLIPSRRKSVRKTKIVLEGSLSLLEAEAIKDCLLSTFKDFDLIDIQLSEITHIDIIAIQLIKVFIDSHPDKTIKVDSELPFDIKLIVERSGFGSLMFKEEVA